MTEADRYREAWQERRSRVFALMAMIVVSVASLRLWPNALIVGGCVVGAIVAAYRFYEFRCPRCRERFLASLIEEPNFWSRQHCQHCSLEKNTVPQEPKP